MEEGLIREAGVADVIITVVNNTIGSGIFIARYHHRPTGYCRHTGLHRLRYAVFIVTTLLCRNRQQVTCSGGTYAGINVSHYHVGIGTGTVNNSD